MGFSPHFSSWAELLIVLETPSHMLSIQSFQPIFYFLFLFNSCFLISKLSPHLYSPPPWIPLKVPGSHFQNLHKILIISFHPLIFFLEF